MADIQDLYSDTQAIRLLRCTDSVKVRMLTALMATFKDAWQVVGVTEAALDLFVKHDFKRVSGMGVNRSHIVDRHKTYKEMLARDMTLDEWWAFHQDRDKCILATSSENMRSKFGRIIEIDPTEGLFKNSGYAWRHGTAEIEFLKKKHTELLSDKRLA